MTHVLRSSEGRGRDRAPGRVTRHSFSFGSHYDPDNVAFGPLIAHNDDVLDPAAGYPDHAHSDTEIVTWVLAGVLVHTDSMGNRSELTPGTVQVQSAGSGIVHSELADAASGPTRFVQSWVRPDAWDLTPARHVSALTNRDASGLLTVAGGTGLPLAAAGARLRVGAPRTGWRGTLPDARLVHLFVATGRVQVATQVGAQVLAAGDALRLVDEPQCPVTVLQDAELLIWSFD